MEGQGLIVWLIVGAVAGWLAGTLVKGGGFGLVGDIIVGILGGFIGGWLAGDSGNSYRRRRPVCRNRYRDHRRGLVHHDFAGAEGDLSYRVRTLRGQDAPCCYSRQQLRRDEARSGCGCDAGKTVAQHARQCDCRIGKRGGGGKPIWAPVM